MGDFVTLRGYAVVFNQTAFLGPGDGRLERIFPGAFSAQLAAGKPIKLQAYEHDPAQPALASTDDGTLTFHEDGTGLGFEARYEPRAPWDWGIVRSIVGRAGMGCSINFSRRIKGRRTIDGASVEIVVSAEIDHVALVTDAAYRGTRVWRADCDLTAAPWTVQVLAANWARGRALAEAARPTACRFGSAPRFSPADLLRFAAVRAETFRRPPAADGYVFAHAAFTRAAGFDG